jgi:hypothetical protein
VSGPLTPCRVLMAAGVPTSQNNGASEAPAVVVRVFDGAVDHVNARVLCDGEGLLWWTSVPVYDDKAAYDVAAAEYAENYPDAGSLRALYWPTRTP